MSSYDRSMWYNKEMKTENKPTRASLPKSALARLYLIDQKIASGKYPNTKHLVKYLRDPWGGQHFHNKPFSGADELVALGMAKSILALYKDTPIYDAARHLLDSIIAPLSAEDNSDWYESRIVVPKMPSAPVPAETWSLITTALRKNYILTFDYQGAYNERGYAFFLFAG